MATIKQLSEVIQGLTYGDLMDVCADLATAASDPEARPSLKTPEEFASLLHDWAETIE